MSLLGQASAQLSVAVPGCVRECQERTRDFRCLWTGGSDTSVGLGSPSVKAGT